MERNRILAAALGIALSITSISALHAQSAYKSQVKVKTGLEVLIDQDFAALKGKRVGLLTNPTGVTSDLRSNIDIFIESPNVNLVALYAPEHGVRGDLYAGEKAPDGIDPISKLPVYSLYGEHRQPTPEMYKEIDVLVYDIQDTGIRSYTFISCLGLAMRTAAATGIEVIVLDRPNPLGGIKMEGCYVEPAYNSYISQYRIPYVYGLTVGELAELINEEGLNRGQKGNEAPLKCNLTVIPMQDWHRDMLYADTGLPWVQTSPNIPTAQSAIHCASSGIIGDISNYLNIGIGYTLPFATFAAPWIEDPRVLRLKLESYNLPGVAFKEIYYTPIAGAGKGKLHRGVQYFYTDYYLATITLTGFYAMQAITELYPDHNPYLPSSRASVRYEKASGTDYLSKHLKEKMDVRPLEDYWMKDIDHFRALASNYFLYE